MMKLICLIFCLTKIVYAFENDPHCQFMPRKGFKYKTCSYFDESKNVPYFVLKLNTYSLNTRLECLTNSTLFVYNEFSPVVHRDWLAKNASHIEVENCSWETLTILYSDSKVMHQLNYRIKTLKIKGSPNKNDTLSSFPGKMYQMFPNLREIDIRNFRYILMADNPSDPQKWPSKLVSVKFFGLDSREVPAFKTSNIKHLWLSNCIQSLEIENVKYFKNLQSLVIHDCSVAQMPQNFSDNVKNLKTLKVTECNVMNCQTFLNTDFILNSVTNLEIGYVNALVEDLVQVLNFTKYPNLRSLSLTFSHSSKKSKEAFDTLIKKVRFPSNNKISLDLSKDSLFLQNPCNATNLFNESCEKWTEFVQFKKSLKQFLPHLPSCETYMDDLCDRSWIIPTSVFCVISLMILTLMLIFHKEIYQRNKDFMAKLYTNGSISSMPYLHSILFKGIKEDESAEISNDIFILYHSGMYCQCGNDSQDYGSEVGLQLKNALIGEDKYCQLTYDGVITREDFIVGKETQWNLEQCLNDSKSCLVIISESFMSFHFNEFKMVVDKLSNTLSW